MKLIWCVKHQKMFILVTVACNYYVISRQSDVVRLKKNPPSWDFKNFRKCQKISKFDLKKIKKNIRMQKLKILEETLHKKRKSHKKKQNLS